MLAVGDHDVRHGTSTASLTFRGKADTRNIELALHPTRGLAEEDKADIAAKYKMRSR
jgi:hypothetical protein